MYCCCPLVKMCFFDNNIPVSPFFSGHLLLADFRCLIVPLNCVMAVRKRVEAVLNVGLRVPSIMLLEVLYRWDVSSFFQKIQRSSLNNNPLFQYKYLALYLHYVGESQSKVYLLGWQAYKKVPCWCIVARIWRLFISAECILTFWCIEYRRDDIFLNAHPWRDLRL